jgi:acyl carrier protein
MPRLRGVVHCAGVLDDGVLLQQDWQRFGKVMSSKVTGSWNLHRLTKNKALDFFVLFSSISSVMGSPGQCNYAAANAFLDALAHHRHALGLPALTVNWGAWSETGMAARGNVAERVHALGMGTISPQQGQQLLEQLMLYSPPQVSVIPVDWSRFIQRIGNGKKILFLSEVAAGGARQEKAPRVSEKKPDIRQRLDSEPSGKRHQILLQFVREQAVKILALDSTQSIDDNQPLTELGLDSLMAVELRGLLTTELELSRNLPATLAFDYPTISALTDHLANEVLSWEKSVRSDSESPEREEMEIIEL